MQLTPIAITVLNAASTLGETMFPYWVGQAFGRKQYLVLGNLLSISQLLALVVTWIVWRQARALAKIRRRDLEFLFD